MTRRTLVFAFVFCAAVVPASAQDVRVRLTLDSASCRLGEWVPATVVVTAPRSVTPALPTAKGGFARAEIVSSEAERTAEKNGMLRREKRYVLALFDTGVVHVAATVRYRKPGDTATYTATSNAVSVRVASVKLDTAITFKDIKDVLDVPLTIWDYLLYLAIALAIAAAGYYGYRWWKRRPVPEAAAPPPPPPRPAFEVAFEKLRALEGRQVWQEGRHKDYQSELSEIVREYIENGFGVPALEQTTGEILDGARRLGWDGEVRSSCGRILTISDMTKFARYVPTPQEHLSGLQAAYAFVERTRPLLTPEAPQQPSHGPAAVGSQPEQPAEAPHG